MGLFRLWLALAVVTWHSNQVLGYTFLHPAFAVRIFFVLSGFYMAMVYEKRYAWQYRPFIISRWLRFYPPYFFVLIVTALGLSALAFFRHVDAGPYEYILGHHIKFPGPVWLLAQVTSLTLVGQDWGHMVRVPVNGAPAFISVIHSAGTVDASALQWLPQAWTLGLEEAFCLTLPLWLSLKDRTLLLLLGAGMAARAWLVSAGGLGGNMITVPPVEITGFFAGILAWRLHQRHSAPYGLWRRLALLVAAVWMIFSVRLGVGLAGQVALFQLAAILLLGPLFELSRNLAFDRFLGELSYPLYLVHVTVFFFCLTMLNPSISDNIGNFVVPISLLAALALWIGLIRPLDKVRRRYLVTP